LAFGGRAREASETRSGRRSIASKLIDLGPSFLGRLPALSVRASMALVSRFFDAGGYKM
jgi:hypothetical protein